MSPFHSYLTARRGEYQGRLMRAEAELARVADWNSDRARHFNRLTALYREMLELLDRHEGEKRAMTAKLSPTLFGLYLDPIARLIDAFAAGGAKPEQIAAARRAYASLMAAIEGCAADAYEQATGAPYSQLPRLMPAEDRQPK